MEERIRLGGASAHEAEDGVIDGVERDLGSGDRLFRVVGDGGGDGDGLAGFVIGGGRGDGDGEARARGLDEELAVAEALLGLFDFAAAVGEAAREEDGDEDVGRVAAEDGDGEDRGVANEVGDVGAAYVVALDGDERGAADRGFHEDLGGLADAIDFAVGDEVDLEFVAIIPGEFFRAADVEADGGLHALAGGVFGGEFEEVEAGFGRPDHGHYSETGTIIGRRDTSADRGIGVNLPVVTAADEREGGEVE